MQDDTPVMPGGRPWTWHTPYGASCRAAFLTLAQTGFRKAEIAIPAGVAWGKLNISFANLTWRIRGKEYSDPGWELLSTLAEGDYAVLRPPPSKPDPFGQRWHNNLVWLPYDPHAPINAARALAQWEIVAGVRGEARRATPLFCGEDGVGTPLLQKPLDTLFHSLLKWVLPPDTTLAPTDYSIHSFRSYLASALMASGRTDAEIQLALRWASPEALKIYKVANAEQYAGWLRGAEQTELTGMRAVQIPPRPAPAHDHLAAYHSLSEGRADLLAQAGLADLDTPTGGGDVTVPEDEVDYDPDASW